MSEDDRKDAADDANDASEDRGKSAECKTPQNIFIRDQNCNDRDDIGDINLHIPYVTAPLNILVEDVDQYSDRDDDEKGAHAAREHTELDDDAIIVQAVGKKKKKVTRIVTQKSLESLKSLHSRRPSSPVEPMSPSKSHQLPSDLAYSSSSAMYSAPYSAQSAVSPRQYYPSYYNHGETVPYALQYAYPQHSQQQQILYQQQAAYMMRYHQQHAIAQQSMLQMRSSSSASSTPKACSKESRSKIKKHTHRSPKGMRDDDYKELAMSDHDPSQDMVVAGGR